MISNEKEITNRTIPGITWKQITAFTIAVAIIIGLYFRLESLAEKAYDQSVLNGEVLKDMQEERKELVRINDAKLRAIDIQLRELEIRIQLFENFVEGYKSIK